MTGCQSQLRPQLHHPALAGDRSTGSWEGLGEEQSQIMMETVKYLSARMWGQVIG